MNRRNRSLLIEGMKRLGLYTPTESVEPFVRFCDEVSMWNRKMNLVGGGERDLIVRHVLDSLAAVPVFREYLSESTSRGDLRPVIADVGSGAGFPGIPLALVLREADFTCIERSEKRAAFLNTVRLLLDLPNVSVTQSDLDSGGHENRYDIVTCRAFRPFGKALPVLESLVQTEGIIAFYSAAPPSEHSGEGWVRRDYPLEVPFLDAERHLIVLDRRTSR